jgi:hypothetical protein
MSRVRHYSQVIALIKEKMQLLPSARGIFVELPIKTGYGSTDIQTSSSHFFARLMA